MKSLRETTIENKNNLQEGLCKQYSWFEKSFLSSIQEASDEFFNELFSLKLISLSKNINVFFAGDEYFVTKIRIDKQHDVFFRCSSDTVKMILDNILGSVKNFNLSSITELEAKIISSFNDYVFGHISKFLLPADPSKKRKNFDTVNLTFFITDKNSKQGSKFIVSLPEVLLNPEIPTEQEAKFDISDFKTSKIDVKIKVGTTKFILKELKNLEPEDLVIFENSDIHSMILDYGDYSKEFKVTPNPGLITSINNDNGGDNMNENSLSQNLWDNIQVEMGAEFEKVKITLGELKNIETGLVVDISSVYDNKISLKVENKIIAKGELVIINDRYGVRIEEVFASERNKAEQLSQAPTEEAKEAIEQGEEIPQEAPQEGEEESADDEFDYSDFELDDEDI